MHIRQIRAATHGRYLVDVPSAAGPLPLLVGFHGYGERAEHMLDVLRRIRGERPWLLISIQALNRFYARRSDDVVACWMTREDRELAIADNLAYVASVLAEVGREYQTTGGIVYLGFSQGVAMAYRAAAFAAATGEGVAAASGVVVLAGDVPPDVATPHVSLPPVLVGRGSHDEWYTAAKAAADEAFFAKAGIDFSPHVFDGGHVWDDSFLVAARTFIDGLSGGNAPT